MHLLHTDPAQHIIAADTGSTVDDLYDLSDLYDLYDLDRHRSEVWNLVNNTVRYTQLHRSHTGVRVRTGQEDMGAGQVFRHRWRCFGSIAHANLLRGRCSSRPAEEALSRRGRKHDHRLGQRPRGLPFTKTCSIHNECTKKKRFYHPVQKIRTVHSWYCPDGCKVGNACLTYRPAVVEATEARLQPGSAIKRFVRWETARFVDSVNQLPTDSSTVFCHLRIKHCRRFLTPSADHNILPRFFFSRSAIHNHAAFCLVLPRSN